MKSIEVCLNCKEKKCRGTCEKIRQAEHGEARCRTLTVNGETHTLGEWAKITGLNYKTITRRIRAGKTGKEIIKTTREHKRRAENGQLHTNS